jgi:hypothetical protein
MISTINELQNLLYEDAEEFEDPLYKSRFLLTNEGCSEERIAFLKKKLPSLPESYTRWLTKLNLNGICIGYFCLSPFSKNPKDIVESILEASEDTFFPKEFMEKHNMYRIGFYNTDLICVAAGSDKYKEGEILFVEEGNNIYNPQDNQIHKLAKNFEQFLLIAGNWYQLPEELNKDNSNYEEKREELKARMKSLGADEEYYPIWISLF